MEEVKEKVGTYNIFVGNIPPGCDDSDIRQIFEEFGTVVECDYSGRAAFVHMEDDIEGKHAVGELQGRSLKGNILKIEESKKHTVVKIPALKLFVKNVSCTVDARGLRNMFKRFGFVLEVELGDGEGHVLLEATGDIGSALKEMNGHVIDQLAMSVEPGPVIPYEELMGPSPNKKSKFTKPGRNTWGPSYSHSEEHCEDYQDDYYDPNREPNPFEMPAVSPFRQPSYRFRNDAPPERILRDPRALPFGNRSGPRFPGGPRFRNNRPPMPFLGFQGVRPIPPRGHPLLRPNVSSHVMFGGMRQPRAPLSSAIPPQMQYTMFNQDRVMRSNGLSQMQSVAPEDDCFYEDEPLPAPAPQRLMALSGANAMPIGGIGDEGLVSRTPGRPPVMFGGRGRRGGGRGRGKFTALTQEVAPGEKYPVPPMHNPSFRAPIKWTNDEPKRKVKKKKQPLVPAELPDYSMPVPDLPKEFIPRGAVLKPFPPPNPGLSHGEFSINGGSSQAMGMDLDFTQDEVV